ARHSRPAQPTAAGGASASASPADPVPSPQDVKFRVLVVDDQEVVTWGFRLLLTREAWVERCITAVSSDQAVAYAQRFSPHVALVDVFLADESGVEVSRRILTESPRTKVLLTSGGARISAKA